jgi:hypothetical protein
MGVSGLRAIVLLTTTVFVVMSPHAANASDRDHATRRADAHLTRASGHSPYKDCDVPLVPHEKTYVNAEVEPWVAADPSDPKHLVGVWQQDRLSKGGAKGLMSAYSFDRGHTWRRSELPFDSCAVGGLDLERASDPWVSIGPDGTVYAASLSLDTLGDGGKAVAASTSADGGATWSDPVIVHGSSSDSGIFDDKETVTADPIRPGVAYATWTAFECCSVVERGGRRVTDLVSTAGVSRITAPLMFSRTTDGGATWEAPRVIFDTRVDEVTNSSEIVVDPISGTVYDVFDAGRTDRRWIRVVASHDAGTTWSRPVKISREFAIGARHPNTGKRLRVGDEVPDAAIDPRNGDVYVVWEDARFSGFRYDEVVLSRSSDGGRTWTHPIRVNTPTHLPAFLPSVEVNAHGTVGVSYYDVREVGSARATLPTDAWLVKLRDGGRLQIHEWKLAGPFDMLTAPKAFGYFLGDYEGLAVSHGRFAAMFAVTNDGRRRNRTDIVFELR